MYTVFSTPFLGYMRNSIIVSTRKRFQIIPAFFYSYYLLLVGIRGCFFLTFEFNFYTKI